MTVGSLPPLAMVRSSRPSDPTPAEDRLHPRGWVWLIWQNPRLGQISSNQVIANEIQYWESLGFRPSEEEYTPDEDGLVELNFGLTPA